MNQYTEIVHIIKEVAGNEELKFDTAITIKRHPHDEQPFYMWGVQVGPKDRIAVMDRNQDWYEITERDELVVASMYQRIKLMSKQTA